MYKEVATISKKDIEVKEAVKTVGGNVEIVFVGAMKQ